MTQTLDPTSTDYRDLIAKAVRIINSTGVMDQNGHVSARDETDPNVFWINNRHASRSSLTQGDIVPFDIRAGQRIGEGIEPPSEWHIHREIYRRNPKVGGITHAHPQFLVTLSAAGQKLRPIIPGGCWIPEDGAPIFDSAVLINSEARGKGMAVALGDAPLVILRQHGVVTIGRSAQESVIRMVAAEENATTQFKRSKSARPTTSAAKNSKYCMASKAEASTASPNAGTTTNKPPARTARSRASSARAANTTLAFSSGGNTG